MCICITCDPWIESADSPNLPGWLKCVTCSVREFVQNSLKVIPPSCIHTHGDTGDGKSMTINEKLLFSPNRPIMATADASNFDEEFKSERTIRKRRSSIFQTRIVTRDQVDDQVDEG